MRDCGNEKIDRSPTHEAVGSNDCLGNDAVTHSRLVIEWQPGPEPQFQPRQP